MPWVKISTECLSSHRLKTESAVASSRAREDPHTLRVTPPLKLKLSKAEAQGCQVLPSKSPPPVIWLATSITPAISTCVIHHSQSIDGLGSHAVATPAEKSDQRLPVNRAHPRTAVARESIGQDISNLEGCACDQVTAPRWSCSCPQSAHNWPQRSLPAAPQQPHNGPLQAGE